LVLVLEHHPIDVPIPGERIGRVELGARKPLEHPFPNLGHDRLTVNDVRKGELASLTPRVLERIEEPGHLDELNGPVEVTG
jgi:hypothetical protein